MATKTKQDQVVDGFVRFTESGEDPDGLLAEDVFADVNVPQWRFQLQGRPAVADWVKTQLGLGTTSHVERVTFTSNGFVLDTHCDIQIPDGTMYCRALYVVETTGGKIGEFTLYCTGGWDADTRERHAAEAPMIRT